MPGKTIRTGFIGALGLMASPGAVHWRDKETIQVLRIHDRGNSGKQRDLSRRSWQEYGANPVSNFDDLIGSDDIDGIFICTGKNGDDLPIIATVTHLLSKKSPGSFICHMSTVSVHFVKAAYDFCTKKQIRYVNYPLTGGPKGAENASMLILASGDHDLYQTLYPSLAFIGKPQYFGTSITAGAEVKLIGHLMVFNGLVGICSAAATHTECLNNGKLGGSEQTTFFDYLNSGAGGTKQWDAILRPGISEDIWNKGFYMRHAVVDAIYLAQLLIERGVSWLAIESVLNTALTFSYVLNNVDNGLATHAIVREMISTQSHSLDKFLVEYSGPKGDPQTCLHKCIQSLPENIRKTVALGVLKTDFEKAVDKFIN